MGWFADFIFGKPASVQKRTDQLEDDWGNTIAPIEEPAEVGDIPPPEIHCTRVDSQLSGDMRHMEVWVYLENISENEVEVTHIECLERSVGLGRFLNPSESHGAKVYEGSVPLNDHATKAKVTYRVVATGEYYEADYTVKYTQSHHDSTELFLPCAFDLVRPVNKL